MTCKTNDPIPSQGLLFARPITIPKRPALLLNGIRQGMCHLVHAVQPWCVFLLTVPRCPGFWGSYVLKTVEFEPWHGESRVEPVEFNEPVINREFSVFAG